MRGEVQIAPGHPKLLGTCPQTNIGLHHYQIDVDRGFSYAQARQMLLDKAAENGGRLFRHEGFMRRRSPWGGERIVLIGGNGEAWRIIDMAWASKAATPEESLMRLDVT